MESIATTASADDGAGVPESICLSVPDPRASRIVTLSFLTHHRGKLNPRHQTHVSLTVESKSKQLRISGGDIQQQ
jgi:hypothetical protein